MILRSFILPSSSLSSLLLTLLLLQQHISFTKCFIIIPTSSSSSSPKPITRLHYNQNDYSSSSSSSSSSSTRRTQDQFEKLERARQSFETLIQEYNIVDGIQDDGIVLCPTSTTNDSTNYNNNNFRGKEQQQHEYGLQQLRSHPVATSSSSSSRFVTYSGSDSSSSSSSSNDGFVTNHDMNDPRLCTDMLLTTSGRLLRELEMKLLHSLIDSDDAAEALIHFWTTERDSYAANDLLVMSSIPSKCSDNLVNEEIMLSTMTEAYPTWAEPYSRLASLLYYKGNYKKAEEMALYALQLKPWHFEANNILIFIYQKLNNHNAVQYYTNKQLPIERYKRVAWVNHAIELAQKQFIYVEKLTIQYNYNKRKHREEQYHHHTQQQQQIMSSSSSSIQSPPPWNHNNMMTNNNNNNNNNKQQLQPNEVWQ